jgi:hypothetical protein
MFGKHALKTAAGIGHDMLEGQSFRQSVKPRLLEGAKFAAREMIPEVVKTIRSPENENERQSGSGCCKKKKSKKRKRVSGSKKRKSAKKQKGGRSDIFG